MAEAYINKLHSGRDPALRRRQRDWLLARNMCANDRECIRRAYFERIAELGGSTTLGSRLSAGMADGEFQPPVADHGRGDPLQQLVTPPSGMRRWAFQVVDRHYALTYLNQVLPGTKERDMETAKRFFVLLAMANNPSIIDRFRDNPSVLATFVDDESAAPFMISNHNAWIGNNPLTQEKNSKDFLKIFRQRLIDVAPRLPMRLTWVEMAHTGSDYDEANNGFSVKTFAASIGSSQQSVELQNVVKDAGLTMGQGFKLPQLFWPVSKNDAEVFLNANSAGHVQIRMSVDLFGIDQKTGELSARLVSAVLYNKEDGRRLYAFPVEAPGDAAAPQADAWPAGTTSAYTARTAGNPWALPLSGTIPLITGTEYEAASVYPPFLAGDSNGGSSSRHPPRERWARFMQALALRIVIRNGAEPSDADAVRLACVFMPSQQQMKLFGQNACGFQSYVPGAEFAINDGGRAFRQTTVKQIVASAPDLPVRARVVMPVEVGHYNQGRFDLKTSVNGPIRIFGSPIDVLLPSSWPASEAEARAFTAIQSSPYGSRAWLAIDLSITGTTPAGSPSVMSTSATGLPDHRSWLFQTAAMTLFADDMLRKPLFTFALDGLRLAQPDAGAEARAKTRTTTPIRMGGELGLLALVSSPHVDTVRINWQQAADSRFRFEQSYADVPNWKNFDPWGRFFSSSPDAANAARYQSWTKERAAALPDHVTFWRLLSPYVATAQGRSISAFGNDNLIVSGFNGMDEQRGSLDDDLARRLWVRGISPDQLAPLRIRMPGNDDVLVLAAFPVAASKYVLDFAAAPMNFTAGGQQPRYAVNAKLSDFDIVKYGPNAGKTAILVRLEPDSATVWQNGAALGTIKLPTIPWAVTPPTLATAADRLAGPPYGYDMLGIRLGMSMDDAEAAVRRHMTVLQTVEGQQAVLNPSSIGPQHGKMFVNQDTGEIIVLYDWPPVAAGRVVAVWRTQPVPRDKWDVVLSDILITKYGQPEVRGDHEAFWTRRPSSDETTGNCLLGSGHDGGVDWRIDGKPFPISTMAGQKPEIPRLRVDSKANYTGCGSVFHARNYQLMSGERVPFEGVLYDLDVLSLITRRIETANQSPPVNETPAIKF